MRYEALLRQARIHVPHLKPRQRRLWAYTQLSHPGFHRHAIPKARKRLLWFLAVCLIIAAPASAKPPHTIHLSNASGTVHLSIPSNIFGQLVTPNMSIQFKQNGSNISGGFFNEVPFNINCSTNLTCTASGSTVTMTAAGGSGSPGGVPFQVQYDNNGAFGGLPDGTTGQILISQGPGVAATFADPQVQGTQAPGSTTIPNPVVSGGSDYGGTAAVRAWKVDSAGSGHISVDGTVTMSLPAQPFLNTTDFNDVVAASPTRGDLVVANSTPKWARFGIDASANKLLHSGADPTWSGVADADILSGVSGTGAKVNQTGATLTPKYFDAAANTTGGTRMVSQYPGADFSVQLQNCINDLKNTSQVGNGGTCDATDFGDTTWSQNITISLHGVHVKLPCNRIGLNGFGFIITGFGTWIEGCAPNGSSAGSNNNISTVVRTDYSTTSGPTGNGGTCAFCIGTKTTDTLNIKINNLAIQTSDDAGLPTPATPVVACSNSGGSLATGTVFVKTALELPTGPTANVNASTAASAEASCSVTGPNGSVTVTAPSLTVHPFATYSVYSSGTTGTEKLQTVSGNCQSITGNCVIQVLGAGASAPATGNAFSSSIVAYRMSNSHFEDIFIKAKTPTNNSGQVSIQLDAANGPETAFNQFNGITIEGSWGLVGFRCQGGTGFCAANTLNNFEYSGDAKTLLGSIGFDFAKGDAHCLACFCDNVETCANISGNGGFYNIRAEPSTVTNHVRLNSGAQVNTVIVTQGGDTVVDNSGNRFNTIIQPDKPPIMQRMASSSGAITTTTLGQPGGMTAFTWTVDAGRTYVWQCVLYYQVSSLTGSPGLAMGTAGTATWTSIIYELEGAVNDNSLTTPYDIGVVQTTAGNKSSLLASLIATTNMPVRFTGSGVVNAGGTLLIDAANLISAGASVTVAQGSFCKVE